MKSAALLLTFVPTFALAWGGRGHHSICSAAVHLVQEKGLREFLKHRPHTMGHLCNIPDIYWKSLGAVAKPGDAGHFIDPEVTGVPLKDIPLSFSVLEKDFTGKANRFKSGATIFSVPDEIGSLWWRADQFYRRSVAGKDALADASLPKGKEEQDEALPYNREVYGLMVNLGLMGHFVGDASQPLHNTADYDGYEAGHGGLHSYYEELCVSEAPADLEARIVAQAKAIKKAAWLEDKPVVERMRAMSVVAAQEWPKVLKLDPLKKKSEMKKDKGMVQKTAAVREPASVGWKKFDAMIVGQMARSARLLASLWDQAYRDLGKPNLGTYRSYKYPFTPEYVPPDYVSASSSLETKAAPSK